MYLYIIESIITLVSSLVKAANSFFVWLNEKFYYDAGKQATENKIMKEENEIDRKQDIEMAKNYTQEDLENKLKKGDF